MERTEKLQNMIDDQASAHQFYFDYPPKPDAALDNKSTKNAGNSESDKLKKIYEEQMSVLKRNSEREFNELQLSMAQEHEEMTSLLSAATLEGIQLKDKYVELDLKFKQYYLRSDHHIKHQAQELASIKEELQSMLYRNKNHEALLQEAERNAKKYEEWYRELEKPFLV